MEKRDSDLAAALRQTAVDRVTIDLPAIWQSFFDVQPELRGEVQARQRLAGALRSLAEARILNFPASRGSYDRTALPILPRFVRLLGEPAPVATRFAHQTFPWSLPMSFVAALPRLPNPEIALRLNDFFRKDGGSRPFVPVKERSYGIFGNEKLLERVLKGQLGNEGGLTLDLLRCYRVPLVPVHLTFANTAPDVLIVENEATFDTAARWNRAHAQFRVIIYGRGREVEKIADFLRSQIQTAPGKVYYFGDVDRQGLMMPHRLSGSVERDGGNPIVPALACYRLLLNQGLSAITNADSDEETETAPEESESAWRNSLRWFPDDLAARVEPVLATDQRIAQEAVGWEQLRHETSLL